MKKVLVLVGLLLASQAHAETIDLDAIIIKASRTEDAIGGMTKSVDVITDEDIALSPAKSLPELLGTKAGVYGIQYGNIKNSQVDMRGFGETSMSNVLVLVDGRRTNQIDLSGQDWAQINLDAIDRIEVIKGAGTVLYGDNATGGVINIITKKGKVNTKPSVTLASEYGSYQTSKNSVFINGGLSKVNYAFNYSHDQSSGYRANSDYWANDFNSSVGFNPNDTFGIDFAQGYHRDKYQMPGALFATNIASFGRRGVRDARNNDRGWTSDQHYDVTPHVKFDVGASEGEVSMFSSTRKRYNKGYSGLTPYETMAVIESYETQPKVMLTTPFGNSDNKAIVGYDLFYAANKRRSGTLGASQDLVNVKKVTHGLYVVDELTLDEKWLFNAGHRYNWSEYIFDQQQQVKGKSGAKGTNYGLDGGIGYKYNPRSKVYANAEKSYRLPAVDEFYQNLYDFGPGSSGGGLNTNLTYQKGNHYEVGIKDNTIEDLNMGLNLFFIHMKNEIYLDPTTFNNTNYDGKSEHYGLEMQASYELIDGMIEPFANWTKQEARFKKGSYSKRDIPSVPDNLFNYGLIVRPVKGLTTSVMGTTVGERFAISDQANTQPKMKRYTTVDWNTSYTYKDIEVWFSLRNIFKEKYNAYGVYSSSSSDTGVYPSPTRNASAGVKVKF